MSTPSARSSADLTRVLLQRPVRWVLRAHERIERGRERAELAGADQLTHAVDGKDHVEVALDAAPVEAEAHVALHEVAHRRVGGERAVRLVPRDERRVAPPVEAGRRDEREPAIAQRLPRRGPRRALVVDDRMREQRLARHLAELVEPRH